MLIISIVALISSALSWLVTKRILDQRHADEVAELLLELEELADQVNLSELSAAEISVAVDSRKKVKASKAKGKKSR